MALLAAGQDGASGNSARTSPGSYQLAASDRHMCSFGRSVTGVSRHPSRSSTFGRSAMICELHLVQNRRSLPGDDSKLDNSSSPRSQRKAARGNGMIVENAAPWVLRQVEQWQWTIGPAEASTS